MSSSPEYNWHDVSIALAASNERLCRIALAADALADAVKRYQAIGSVPNHSAMEHALDAYAAVRSGS